MLHKDRGSIFAAFERYSDHHQTKNTEYAYDVDRSMGENAAEKTEEDDLVQHICGIGKNRSAREHDKSFTTLV